MAATARPPRGKAQVRDLATFGQELCPEAAARLARLALADPAPARAELREALVRELPMRSGATRRRVADKLLQRLVEFEEGRPRRTLLLVLLAQGRDPRARAQLTYYQTVAVEGLLEALVERLCYPYLVQGKPPPGLGRAQFAAANAVGLFESDRALTRHFISAYARSAWGFGSETTLTRALRMMRQAGVVQPLPRTAMGRPLLSFARVPLVPTAAASAHGLYEEFGEAGGAPRHRVEAGRLARRFLLEPIQVSVALQELRRRGLVRFSLRAGERWVTLPCRSPEEVRDRL